MENQEMLELQELEETLTANFEIYIEVRDIESFISAIQDNHLAFDITLNFLKEAMFKLDDASDPSFFIDVLDRLIQEFGVPVVLALDHSKFTSWLKKYQDIYRNEIKALLESCLQVFSFDQHRSSIQHLSDFFIETFGSQTYPNLETPKGDYFIELYCRFQSCFDAFKDCERTGGTKDIAILISHNLLNEYHLDDEISPLNRACLEKMKAKLEEILRKNEEEIEKAKEAKKQKELQKELLKQLPAEKQLKNRNSFIKGETLPFEESTEVEFKDYTLPFNDQLQQTLSKTINSFMNVRGGRIYVGVKDNRNVKGIRLTPKQKGIFEGVIRDLVSKFEPDVIPKDQIKFQYIPVLNPADKLHILNLWVAKIIIKQGNPSILYSSRKDVMECYIRYEGQSKILSSAETRSRLISQHFNPGPRVPEEEFEDKEAETFQGVLQCSDEDSKMQDWEDEAHTSLTDEKKIQNENIKPQFSEDLLKVKPRPQNLVREEIKSHLETFEDQKMDITEKSKSPKTSPLVLDNDQGDGEKGGKSDKKKSKKKGAKVVEKEKESKPYFSDQVKKFATNVEVHEIFAQGLPDWTEDQFNEFIDGLKLSSLFSKKMFKTDAQKCNGKAFFNFTSLEEATHFKNTFDGTVMNGKQLSVDFKKVQKKN